MRDDNANINERMDSGETGGLLVEVKRMQCGGCGQEKGLESERAGKRTRGNGIECVAWRVDVKDGEENRGEEAEGDEGAGHELPSHRFRRCNQSSYSTQRSNTTIHMLLDFSSSNVP